MMDVVRKTPKRYKEHFNDILRLIKIINIELVYKTLLTTETRIVMASCTPWYHPCSVVK